jgi:hypothetical protein
MKKTTEKFIYFPIRKVPLDEWEIVRQCAVQENLSVQRLIKRAINNELKQCRFRKIDWKGGSIDGSSKV